MKPISLSISDNRRSTYQVPATEEIRMNAEDTLLTGSDEQDALDIESGEPWPVDSETGLPLLPW